VRSVFACRFAIVVYLLVTNKIDDQGKDRGIFDPRGKSLCQPCVDHPRFKID
jgi:hypothetical protein